MVSVGKKQEGLSGMLKMSFMLIRVVVGYISISTQVKIHCAVHTKDFFILHMSWKIKSGKK